MNLWTLNFGVFGDSCVPASGLFISVFVKLLSSIWLLELLGWTLCEADMWSWYKRLEEMQTVSLFFGMHNSWAGQLGLMLNFRHMWNFKYLRIVLKNLLNLIESLHNAVNKTYNNRKIYNSVNDCYCHFIINHIAIINYLQAWLTWPAWNDNV